MYQFSLICAIVIIITLTILGVDCSTYYSRSYESSGYPSSTMANLNNNFQYGKGVSYGSDFANSPDATRYPSYSPGYGYSGYSTPGYNSYSSTRYPDGSAYSTNSYNTLYSGGSSNVNNNQGINRYGSGYGTGVGSSYSSGVGSTYGPGLGSNYGSAVGSTYGTGVGSTYGSGVGSTYGSGVGSSYGSGLGSTYGSGYATGYSNYGSGSTPGGSSRGGYSPYETPFMRNDNFGTCVNRSPQMGIWVDSLMGMWYGVEYIQHLGVDSRVDYMWTCIVIHIAEPMDRPSTENQPYHAQAIEAKFRQQYRHLRLIWDEAGFKTEYALYFRNDTAGYWHVFERQNVSGTQTAVNNYQHFSGTIQVLKAVNDHLVLNFCQEGDNYRSQQLYTVLFSRNPGEIDQWTIDTVHGMLQSKQLSISSRRMVCGNNSAEKAMYSIVVSILTCAFAIVLGSS